MAFDLANLGVTMKLIGNYMLMNNTLVPLEGEEMRTLKLIEYLLGHDVPGFGVMFSEKSPEGEKNRVPLLASPFSRHLHEINRFLFAGGLSADVVGQSAPDPRQIWVDNLIRHASLNSLLDDIWRKGAATGEIFIAFHQHTDLDGAATTMFNLCVYDKTEFEPTYDEGRNLKKVTVLSTRCKKSPRTGKMEDYLFKVEYNHEFYIKWPEVPMEQAQRGDFTPPVVIHHGYGCVPGVVVKNAGQDSLVRGRSQFDKGAIDMACDIAIQLSEASSNYHYFGHQIILAPDVRDTIKRLKAKSRVLEMSKDDGEPKVLDMKPVPADHPKIIDDMTRRLLSHLGTPVVQDQLSADTSSLALRLLFSGSISAAQEKWEAYVTDGLEPLFAKLLKAAAFEGILGNVNPMDPSTYTVKFSRKQPFFPESPQEKSAQLDVVERLVLLGVRKEDALAAEFWTNMSPEEILEKLEGDI
jgi:hypothetical protein